MRIAMLSPVLPAHGQGGVQDIVWSLARGLASRGHDVTLVTTARGDGVTEERADGVSVRYLAGTTPMRTAGAWLSKSENAVAALHALQPLDVIHSQSFCAVHMARRIKGVPVVASLHGTHVDEMRTCGRLLAESLRGLALRDAARSVYVWGVMMRRMRDEGALLRLCDAVIATSNEQRALLAREYRVPRERLFDVWNGIDVALFSPRAADPAARAMLGGTDGKPLVLAVARLYQDKGIQHLLRAFRGIEMAHPGARLAIVGDGAYRRELESLAGSLALGDRARFVGAVALEQLPALYAAADVFVNSTVRINGYDLTILQAMAMERAVVVSNIGSVPTAVQDLEDGMLVPPGEPRAIARAVAYLLAQPGKRSALGEHARRTIKERFSLDSMIEGTLAVYERSRADASSSPTGAAAAGGAARPDAQGEPG